MTAHSDGVVAAPVSPHPLVQHLQRKAAAIPRSDSGAHGVVVARLRAKAAAEIVAAAVRVDPTLPDCDRCQREIDVIAEIFRQLKPLARQVEVHQQRQELEAAGADEREIARLGRTNPGAAAELDAMSQRAVEIAYQVKAAAVTEWTPQLVRKRSEGLMPDERELERIAEQLRYAIKDALALSHPADEAVRIASLADQIDGGRKADTWST